MKKVIQSKHFTKKCPEIRKTQDGPKQLLFNNWATRNDSSKVAALLHPDHYLEKPRRRLKDVPDKAARNTDKETGVYRKCCLGTNTCYCREDAIKPSMLRRPNKCLSLEEFEERFKEKLPAGRNSLYCFCKAGSASAEHVDLSDHEILQKYQEEMDGINKNLQITDQRKDYEIFRDMEQLEYLKDIGQYKNSTITSRLPNVPTYYSKSFHYKKPNVLRKHYRSLENLVSDNEDYGCNHLSKKQREKLPIYRGNNNSHGNSEGNCFTNYVENDDEDIFLDSRSKEAPKEKCRKSLSSCNTPCVTHQCSEQFLINQRSNEDDDHQNTYCKNVRYNHLGADELSSEIYPSRQKTVNRAMDTDQFKKFRNDNYFETHDLEDYLVEDIPDHTCVYKYELDGRNMPVGVNVDIYGQSRCAYCNKPMDGLQEKSYFGDQISSNRLKNISKCHQLGLEPNTVIRSSSTIEVKVDREDICNRFIGRCQRPQYTNTFALRQQKMVTYKQRNVY